MMGFHNSKGSYRFWLYMLKRGLSYVVITPPGVP